MATSVTVELISPDALYRSPVPEFDTDAYCGTAATVIRAATGMPANNHAKEGS